MGIRWRLAVTVVQLGLLLGATYYDTGKLVSPEPWFAAGLLAVVVNPQLLEPWYSKPQDVLANSLIALFLFAGTQPTLSSPGWSVFTVFLGMVCVAAIVSLVVGADTAIPSFQAVGKIAQQISSIASASIIFSVVFWLSLLEAKPSLPFEFWLLGAVWAAILFLGNVNWQRIIRIALQKSYLCAPEGLLGPSVLRVSSSDLPAPGSLVRLEARGKSATGVTITRIRRLKDEFGEILITSGEPNLLLRASSLEIETNNQTESSIIGFVDIGSTDRSIRFVSARPLATGTVVAVCEIGFQVLYQTTSAEVERTETKGGSHLVTRVRALQIGVFDANTGRLTRHEWVPTPGSAVSLPQLLAEPDLHQEMFKIGNVSGSSTPVYLNLDMLCEGHCSILGMTRMGKSSFAGRLAQALANARRVLVLDQTGEYARKKGYQRATKEFFSGVDPGLAVFEPNPGDLPARRALECLEYLIARAQQEYALGDPAKRVVMLEEAHQFVPEPASLGFNAPGRDEATRIAMYMMQIRKYGISVIMISQRTAVVAKSALSQCENVIAFRSVDQTGLDYLEGTMGSEIRTTLPRLGQGQAVVSGPAFSSEVPVVVDLDPPNIEHAVVNQIADPEVQLEHAES